MRLESLRVLIPEVCDNNMFSIKQHPRVKKVGPVQVLGPDACMLYATTHVIGRCSEVSDEGQDSYTVGESLNPKPSKLSRWVCASLTMGEAANSTIKAATSPGIQILRGSRPPVWSSFELAG